MIDEHFIPVVELPNTVAGFSPSIKELPKGSFIPPDWNKDRFAAVFMYKHKLMPGKHFVLALVGMCVSEWEDNECSYRVDCTEL